ncbi:DNA mismatch repair protein MutS [Sorangium cellulosum]|uniref:DNA mismatch repair protein MutS n=1 Tax=Sorangium cellulosum TaxID=56 RepID=A0A4P2PVM1_SORCE|nr:MutS family DNA mismatch repair protein [Sorangium cellulosum]AUX20845.1 DNA mismatch repair protein MutS [Sorangium cellulosum]
MEPPPTSVAQRVLSAYDERLAVLRAEASALDRRSRTFSLLRGLSFVAALVSGGYALFGQAPRPVAYGAAAVTAAFLGLLVAHARLVTRMTEVEQRIGLYARGKRRVAGDFADFPERGDRFAAPDHDYAGDLDVFGQASLFQLLSVAQTGEGEATLAAWLTEPAGAPAVAARQEAVRELAGLGAFREELAVVGMQAGARGREAGPLIAWAEAPPALLGAEARAGFGLPVRALVTAAKALVPLTLAGLAAAQLLPAEQLGPLRHAWLLPLAAQFLVLVALRPATEPILAAASSREAPFARYRPILACIEQQAFSSALLRELKAELAGPSGALASREMTALETRVGYADLRHSGLIHLVADIFLLWDVWCALALERWKLRAGRHVKAWMRSLGQVEALASLATFAHENPDHAYPDVQDGEPRFVATGLGHPLLPRGRRVTNDVALVGAGAALLVTGSNMSGKSTLLRAIGVNAALALAGAPVCASSLALSPVRVRTSMRIKDSLEHGVSHFYAELTRLKRVVDGVNQGEPVLFLLDEILHGTNARERQIGARAVVRHLVARGAIGAVSSHDMGLSVLEQETAGRVRNVHFEELVVDGKMSFDYTLKPGVVTSANALRLMKIVGIDVDFSDGERAAAPAAATTARE